MKNLNQWINWKATIAPGQKKPDKVPFCFKTNRKIDAHDPANWMTFTEAKSPCDNVGFVLTLNDPYFCIDLDDCLENGAWSQFSKDVLAWFPGAYVEISYSQDGLHIFGRYEGVLPEHKCKVTISESSLELYSNRRFIAYTECMPTGDCNTDCTVNLNKFINQYMAPDHNQNSGPVPVRSSEKYGGYLTPDTEWRGPEDDDELLRRISNQNAVNAAMGNKAPFKALWENDKTVLAKFYPDPTEKNPYDRSSADAALASHLAFWTGRDGPRIERMMRKSALMRVKWDKHKEYLPKYTIPNMCKLNTQVCNEETEGKEQEAEKIIEFSEDDIIDVTKIPTTRVGHEHGKAKPQRLTALKILALYQGRILRIGESLVWWSGREWQKMSEFILKQMIARCTPVNFDNNAAINGIYQMLLYEVPTVKVLSSCRRIFFLDGVLDIDSGIISQHNKENLNTGVLTIKCRDLTQTTEWNKFLISIFGSLEDDRVGLLQEMFGWLLISDNLGLEKYISFTGATRSGKGVILRVIRRILGKDFCGMINFNSIGSPEAHSALWAYRVVMDTEAKLPHRDKRMEALSTIQKITANEPLSSKRLYYNDNLEGVVNCKLIMACNELPIFPDDSGASGSRIAILKFDKSFLGRVDKHLFQRLSKELPGIAQWAIAGLCRLIANDGNFTVTKSSKEEMNDLDSMEKPLSMFIQDSLIIDRTSKVSSANLYNAFKFYASVNNFPLWSLNLFIRRLKNTLLSENLDWKKISLSNGRIVRGVVGLRIDDTVIIPGLLSDSIPQSPTALEPVSITPKPAPPMPTSSDSVPQSPTALEPVSTTSGPAPPPPTPTLIKTNVPI